MKKEAPQACDVPIICRKVSKYFLIKRKQADISYFIKFCRSLSRFSHSSCCARRSPGKTTCRRFLEPLWPCGRFCPHRHPMPSPGPPQHDPPSERLKRLSRPHRQYPLNQGCLKAFSNPFFSGVFPHSPGNNLCRAGSQRNTSYNVLFFLLHIYYNRQKNF